MTDTRNATILAHIRQSIDDALEAKGFTARDYLTPVLTLSKPDKYAETRIITGDKMSVEITPPIYENAHITTQGFFHPLDENIVKITMSLRLEAERQSGLPLFEVVAFFYKVECSSFSVRESSVDATRYDIKELLQQESHVRAEQE